MNLLNTKIKPVILSLNGICYDIIFYFLNVRIMTQLFIAPNHIKNIKNMTYPHNLSTILYEDNILHEKNGKK